MVPSLTADQQMEIGRGTLLLDQMTRSFIRAQLGYRFAVCRDGAEDLSVEHDIRAGSLPAGPPYLNPLWAPEPLIYSVPRAEVPTRTARGCYPVNSTYSRKIR